MRTDVSEALSAAKAALEAHGKILRYERAEDWVMALGMVGGALRVSYRGRYSAPAFALALRLMVVTAYAAAAWAAELPPATAGGGLGWADFLRAVAGERARQDARYGPAHDDTHAPADWFTFIHLQARLAPLGPAFTPPAFASRMVRVAALAEAALEWEARRAERAAASPQRA